MKIKKMEILPVSIPYIGRPIIGHHVIVRLFTDEGVTGVGESSTLSIWGKAQQGAVVSQLQNFIAQYILGADPFDIEKILNHFRIRRPIETPGQIEIIGSEGYISLTALASINDALYDIMGKKCGVPVHRLLGGAFRKKIGVSRSIAIKSPGENAMDAVRLKEMGYKLLTLKIGLDPDTDIKRVKEVRKAIGNDFPLEVDANQSYTPAEAIRTLRKMEEYNILNVEQPCPGWDLDGMAEVTRAIDTPVIADESVTSPSAVLEIIKKRAADVICLKPARDGGLYFCKKMAAAAELAGIGISLGSAHPFGVGTAALHHFVACTPWASTPIGYGRPQERFADDIITEEIPMKDGEVTVLERPGLGVELDENKVKKYASSPPIVLTI